MREGISNRLRKASNSLMMEICRAFPRMYGRPTNITIDVTNRCNSKCPTCDKWKVKEKNDLDLKYIKGFIDQVFRITSQRQVRICGGEPLLRKDICDIVNYITSLGGYPGVLTNGIALDRKMIDHLARSGVYDITISLNSIHGKFHDRTRGYKGNLEKIKDSVDYLKDNHPNIRIIFVAIFFPDRPEQMKKIIDYADEVGAYLSFQPLIGKENLIKSKVDVQKIEKELKHLLKKKYSGSLVTIKDSYLEGFNGKNLKRGKCLIPYTNIRLHWDGKVNSCSHLEPIGDIKTGEVSGMWRSVVAKNVRKKGILCKRDCMSQCNMRPTAYDILKEVYHFIRFRIFI